nr:MAG TPA: Photosystem II protein D1 1 II, Time resolved, Free [Bacteriophage sp.]
MRYRKMLSNFLLSVIAILLFLVTCIIVYLFVDADEVQKNAE